MNGQRPKILGIAEAPENLLMLGAELITDFDLQIVTSSAAGFALASQLSPDLILLDVLLPATKGFETCRTLKAEPALKDVPIVFVSDFYDLDLEMKGLALGAADYFSKPINVEISRLRIRNLLERERLRKIVEAQRDLLKIEVTDRKHVEVALHDSNEALNGVLETTLDGFWLVDLQCNLLEVNPAYCKLSGYTREELLGMRISNLDATEPVAFVKERIDRLVKEGRERFETRHRRKNGSIWLVEVSATYSEVLGGKIFVFLRDITELKQAEEILCKLSIAVEQSPVSVVITDLEGCIEYVNPWFAEVTGYSAAEVIGQNPRIFQSGQTSEKTYMELWAKLSCGEVWRGEFLNRRKNGELYWEETNVAPAKNPAGTVTHYVAMKTDVTERVQLKAAREEALSRLQKIASRVPGVVYQYRLRSDGSACFPFASEAIRDVYRVSPEQVRTDASKVWAVVHPDDYDGVAASILKSARDLTPWHTEYRVKFEDGTVRWLLGNSIPEREADGATLWHGFITDITERKQAEVKQAENESLLQTLIHAIPDLVWLKDPEGVYLACNARFESFFGAPEGDIVGHTDYDFVGQEVADSFRENDMAAMAANATHVNEEWVTFVSDGHRELLETSKTPMFDANGNLLGVLGIGHDISERKQAEETLRVSDLALKAVSQGVLISNPDGLILLVNDAFSSITGYSQMEILGRTCSFMQGPLTDQKTVAAVRLALDNVIEFSGEILNYRKDGSAFWNDMTISPVRSEHGQLTNFIGITRDISDRKLVEAALKESEAYKLAILNSLPNEIAVVDLDGVIQAVNEPWQHFAMENGIEPSQPAPHTSVGTNYLEVCEAASACVSPDVLAAQQGIRAVLDGSLPSFSVEYPCDSPTQRRWFTMNVLPLGQATRSGAVIVHTDITESKQMEEQVRQLAFYDPLTQLPNRRLLSDRLSHAMTSSNRGGVHGALMFLDLDNFKSLNDTQGHVAGDLLLVEVADRLKNCVREIDTVARFGGDEFVVMITNLDVDKAKSAARAKIIAEKIRAALAKPYVLKFQDEEQAETSIKHCCTASIGVALFFNHESSPDIYQA